MGLNSEEIDFNARNPCCDSPYLAWDISIEFCPYFERGC